MNESKKLIAEAFMEHWNQQIAEGTPITPIQEQLAHQLLDSKYPLGIDKYNIVETVKNQDILIKNYFADPGSIADDSTIKLNIHQYSWSSVEPETKSIILERLGRGANKYKLDNSTTQIDVCDLDWYDKYRLVRLVDSKWLNAKLNLYYLFGPEYELLRLDGTSPPIHEANAKAPINLNENNVLSYLMFFCFFVRGEEGPFYLIESIEDPFLDELKDPSKHNRLTELTIDIIEGTARPAKLRAKNEQGNYICDGVIFYSNAIFIAEFALQQTGMIEMLTDIPFASELPFRIQAPIV